jgi:hypothetical protein
MGTAAWTPPVPSPNHHNGGSPIKTVHHLPDEVRMRSAAFRTPAAQSHPSDPL